MIFYELKDILIENQEENMSRPERFKVPVGIFIMLRQDDKVLLQLRQNCSFSGHWGFVGGHLDGKKAIFKINSGISFYEDTF